MSKIIDISRSRNLTIDHDGIYINLNENVPKPRFLILGGTDTKMLPLLHYKLKEPYLVI